MKRKTIVFILVFLLTGFGMYDNAGQTDLKTDDYSGTPVVAIDIDESFDLENFLSSGTGMADEHGFRFIRIKFLDWYGGGSSNGMRGIWNRRRSTAKWAYDYPTAEDNLYEAIDKTTYIELAGRHLVLTLKDEKIFEHPILYLTEPGYWVTDMTEVKNLREYFARGGFVIFDDFHDYGGKGTQWYNWYNNIKLVFPDREPERLAPDHPIWSIFYNIDPVEAPSTKNGDRYWDEYYAIYDDLGRMMSVICYNQDIGDGWEWPNRNLAKASTISFQMAINFIIYAYTH